MEIERKYLVAELPGELERYEKKEIAQAYLCVNPVVRIRKSDDEYYLTYKGRGLMVREEYNLPLTKDGYEHMLPKADGIVIEKVRYLIPLEGGLTAELDVFGGELQGLVLVEVEFPTVGEAERFSPPDWFGEDVTNSSVYHNSSLSSSGLPKENNN